VGLPQFIPHDLKHLLLMPRQLLLNVGMHFVDEGVDLLVCCCDLLFVSLENRFDYFLEKTDELAAHGVLEERSESGGRLGLALLLVSSFERAQKVHYQIKLLTIIIPNDIHYSISTTLLIFLVSANKLCILWLSIGFRYDNIDISS
jgi:hypothetical protein